MNAKLFFILFCAAFFSAPIRANIENAEQVSFTVILCQEIILKSDLFVYEADRINLEHARGKVSNYFSKKYSKEDRNQLWITASFSALARIDEAQREAEEENSKILFIGRQERVFKSFRSKLNKLLDNCRKDLQLVINDRSLN